MSNVLFIKANNRPAEQSVSVKLYNEFLENYKLNNPEDEITELDLFAEQLPYYDNTLITGMYKAAQGYELTAEEAAGAAVVNKYLEQFIAADKVVFGFPLWNMTVPAVLHTYVDYLCQAGKTFSYTAEGPVGLLTGKKAIVLNARGGIYSEGPAASAEMAVNFIVGNLNLWGIKDITQVIIEGHNQLPAQSAEIIENGLQLAKETAASF
ncbi:FMN-dependent NADH-azoreductase [Paenibacillus sp. FSL E2-8871]|jgi:FMN-dependent NADH-azoreductase|uniref:FMN dependent NADH:quinone oxidoreductase n=2 Tax=Paenibacillus TaxID=44249 RepID=A0ABX3HV56_9BACL|nr:MULTISPECIES: FMN-dependent NADH-azoreductase [Paenibacillus]HBS45589.1 FMN-dependent NADH-azoreductase [Paenibacillus sp.]AIQ24407.1 FMN-dependent NADH-azoreductase [Paenibacillus sp. FSL H7-0737]KAA1180752.1 FMN-dependent NADH-azoreductase [Paenibacillus sp. B2(2019)]KTD86428.1 FMN-dependent NADH-azoreductase [Paenibacillus etheri]OMD54127.1 FMN-dependent NADH-azoreductase [Paenibacillus odorifer]